mmetsp:Transcript_36573/g.55956  ORF Transcript_36573/g.55956 Transcript_36573/m.55956 type:complete len:107 (-) Transcript_36573:1681-2001(-)
MISWSSMSNTFFQLRHQHFFSLQIEFLTTKQANVMPRYFRYIGLKCVSFTKKVTIYTSRACSTATERICIMNMYNTSNCSLPIHSHPKYHIISFTITQSPVPSDTR